VAAAANRIEVERVDGATAIVRMGGEHDLSTAADLKAVLRELISEGRSTVVDLGRATFVDSSILAVLLEAREDGETAGVGFTLSLPSATAPGVRRVVEITGLGAAVPLDEEDEAAEADRGEAIG
jgi:anti-anti-sigma factor